MHLPLTWERRLDLRYDDRVEAGSRTAVWKTEYHEEPVELQRDIGADFIRISGGRARDAGRTGSVQ